MNSPQMYRKRPVVVEAMRLTKWNLAEVYHWVYFHIANDVRLRRASQTLEIVTLEGTMTAGIGDWVIRGTQGEFYPCKTKPFADTYELIADLNGEE